MYWWDMIGQRWIQSFLQQNKFGCISIFAAKLDFPQAITVEGCKHF